MPKFEPDRLARLTGGEWIENRMPGEVTGFCHDSRLIQRGQMFAALSDSRDGHDYVPRAHAAGAVAALVTRRVEVALPQLKVADTLAALQALAAAHRREFKGKVAGITGSCGKTSTKDMLASLLGQRVAATVGNFNNTLGVPLSLLRLDSSEHDYGVFEAGINQPGEMVVLGGMIQPDLALVTMVGPAHLEGLGTVDAVAREKSGLVHAAVAAGGLAVLPLSCAGFEAFAEYRDTAWWVGPEEGFADTMPKGRRAGYSLEAGSKGGAHSLCLRQHGFAELRLRFPAMGPGMTSNLVLAVVAARLLGVSDSALTDITGNWSPSHHRGELCRDGDKLYYIDCYNSNPASMREAMTAFAMLADENLPRLWIVGGMKELGPEARHHHRETAAALPWREGDVVVAVGVECAWLAEGFRERWPEIDLACFQNPLDARDILRTFSGAVFLKGSRAYALERLLPDSACQKEAQPC